VNFLNIINPNQGIWLFDQWIVRARFGLHLQLNNDAEKIESAFMNGDSAKASKLINAYFLLVGLKTDGQSGFDLLLAYYQLVELNQLQTTFAFQKWKNPEKIKQVAYHYDGHYITWWIHKLALHYSWSRDDIFNLWPEEVSAYLQEILVYELNEHERQRGMTETSYQYDKNSKTSRFIPTPRPSWMVDSGEKPKMIRIRKSMLPMGVIIKLDDLVH